MLIKKRPPAAADIVSALYEAALAPSLWGDALAKIGARTGADAVILYRAGLTGEAGVVLSGLPGDPLLRQRFVEEARLNPFIPRLASAPLFEPHGDRDLIPRGELERTAFFRDWIEPFDMSDGLMTTLAPLGPDAAMLTLIRKGRSQNAFEEQAVKRLGRIIPYVRRAVEVQREVMARAVLPEAAGAFLLNRIAIPAVILNGENRLVWGNDAAMDLLLAGGSLALARDGSLDAATAQGRRALAHVLAAAFGGGGGCARLDRPSGLPLVILALPLDGSTLGASVADAPGSVTLLLLDGSAQSPSAAAADRFRGLFKLSPAELAVALLIAQDKSLPQIAAALGIAPSTVRTHVKSLFFKTETHSQGALCRLLRQIDLVRG